MRKALFALAVLAIALPVSAAQLDVADAIPWAAPWGNSAGVTVEGDGSITLTMAPTGSAGLIWRIPAYESEIVTIDGIWSGDTDGAGWAEIMLFTSTEGLTDEDIITRVDTGNAADIAMKHDSWGLGSVWQDEVVDLEIHATCAEVIVALKVGDGGGSGTWANYNLDVVPEPATALLLGLPMLLVRRRR